MLLELRYAPGSEIAQRELRRRIVLRRLHRLSRGWLRPLHEFQRDGVHAVAQPCRLRAIIEHVAQVRITAAAGDSRAAHAEGPVLEVSTTFLSDMG